MDDEYRILEKAKDEFIVLKKVEYTKGYLWWRGIHTKWVRVDKYNNQLITTAFYTNLTDLITYSNKEDAIKWIRNRRVLPMTYNSEGYVTNPITN